MPSARVPSTGTRQPADGAGAGEFDALAQSLLAEELAASPVLATALGVTAHDGELPDLTASGHAARAQREDAWAQRLSALRDEDLDEVERVDRDLVLMRLAGRRALRDCADWRRAPETYTSAVLLGVHQLLLHGLREDGDLTAALAARLRLAPDVLAAGRANLDPELAHPELVRRGVAQARAGAAYLRLLAAGLGEVPGRGAVATAGERAADALDDWTTYLVDLSGRARGEFAIGEARYDALLREAEGLGYGARELRERGRTAYDELLADVRRRTTALGGGDDWRGLLAQIAADAPATPDEMLERYRQVTALARQFCIDRDLVTLPPGERCDVVPSAPFTRAMVAVAHYQAPPPFAARTLGHFFVPYPPDGASEEQMRQRLATNSRCGLWPVAVHEAYPGHHWQLAHVASTAHDGRLRPLRHVFTSAYFVEGWGLYAEDLMREQGFYRDPRQELSQRDSRMFRAARMVVDPSLHLGEMTIDEATSFLAGATSLSPGTARTEVLRYCSAPTQAASYLTGALEIARMRDRWLGEARGSLREFHDRAGATGRLPISLVERSVFGPSASA